LNEPRSASYRVLASLCYLPPVAIAVLLTPSYRPVRHLRVHATTSLVLMGLGWGGAIGIGLLASWLGAIPGVGFALLTLFGALLSLWLIAVGGVAIAAAVAGYQGRAPRVVGLEAVMKRLDRWIEVRFVQPLGQVPRRRAKRTKRA
jgi:predicted membrane channel-forming protein YqfA (hemolysin III family)